MTGVTTRPTNALASKSTAVKDVSKDELNYLHGFSRFTVPCIINGKVISFLFTTYNFHLHFPSICLFSQFNAVLQI